MTDPIVTGGIGAAIVGALAALVRHLEIRHRFNGQRPEDRSLDKILETIQLAEKSHILVMEREQN